MKLSTIVVVVISALLLSCSSSVIRKISSDEGDMEYVDVCDQNGNCRKFSRLIMGTDHLVQANWTSEGQAEISEEAAFSVLDEAAGLGINLFDTSPIYVGGVEYKLGRWIKSRQEANPDRKLYALSKGGFPFDLFWSKKLAQGAHSPELKVTLKRNGVLNDEASELKNVPPGTYASRLYGNESQIKTRVTEEMGHSLRNLNDNITVYLMHRDDGDYFKFDEVKRQKTAVHTIMQALSAEQISSKFTFLGWSNWQTVRINESIKLAEQNPALTRPMLNSPYFSLFEMSKRTIHAGGVQVTHKEMMDENFQKGIKIMPYSPLGGFSIFDKPEPKWENAKKAAKLKYDQGDAYWKNVYHAIFTAENQARYERVVKFTEEFNQNHSTNYTLDQMINAYALAHKRTDFLAVGPITVEQLRRTVASLKLARMLTDSDLEYLYSGKL
ncbi:MAG: aldo/keto reductase [Bdellovibrio sp.]|nr:aldo/keto reductase [Bdellovibrio sp.]